MSDSSSPERLARAASASAEVPATPGHDAANRPPPRDHWTPSRQRIFLAALLETGSVAGAARAAGMSRSSAHRLRRRLAGTPFDRAWDQVVTLHARRLADPLAPDRLMQPPAPPSRPSLPAGEARR